MLQSLFESGRIADVILALIALEVVGFAAFHRLTGRGLPVRQLIANLLSGAFLILAYRSAATGAPWTVAAVCLALAFAAHLADLIARLQQR